MVEYKLVNGKFTEDGHIMFLEDVLTRLKRLDILEKYKNKVPKIVDKYFYNYDDHHYECDGLFVSEVLDVFSEVSD